MKKIIKSPLIFWGIVVGIFVVIYNYFFSNNNATQNNNQISNNQTNNSVQSTSSTGGNQNINPVNQVPPTITNPGLLTPFLTNISTMIILIILSTNIHAQNNGSNLSQNWSNTQSLVRYNATGMVQRHIISLRSVDSSFLWLDPTDNLIHYVLQDGIQRTALSGTGSSLVNSFNSRIGAVIPLANDYSFAQLSGTNNIILSGTSPTLYGTPPSLELIPAQGITIQYGGTYPIQSAQTFLVNNYYNASGYGPTNYNNGNASLFGISQSGLTYYVYPYNPAGTTLYSGRTVVFTVDTVGNTRSNGFVGGAAKNFTGSTNITATYNLGTVAKASVYIYSGTSAATYTLMNPATNNYDFIIINFSAYTVTINTYSASTYIVPLNTTTQVTTYLLTTGNQIHFWNDGNSRSYQIN